jgi:hypothetical protein
MLEKKNILVEKWHWRFPAAVTLDTAWCCTLNKMRRIRPTVRPKTDDISASFPLCMLKHDKRMSQDVTRCYSKWEWQSLDTRAVVCDMWRRTEGKQTGAWGCFLLQNVKTASWDHPASYLVAAECVDLNLHSQIPSRNCSKFFAPLYINFITHIRWSEFMFSNVWGQRGGTNPKIPHKSLQTVCGRK